ncbi:MAG: 3-oxoadipate enol-lactonase [Actinomycetota bacterium]|nr:3-oxoadipate enol-lactonase [Actinomycetota bacterium]
MTYSRLDGPADAPVVVLSNSLGTTLEMWEPQVPALGERFAVLRYDHPGHGTSRGSPKATSVEALARGVLEILDERGLERVSFCGLSLGGAVGMWLAMHEPERIDRLALACTSARFGVRENWLARAATVRAGGVEAVADAVLQLWFTQRTHRDAPGLVRAYRAMMTSAAREGYAGCCEALADWDAGDELSAIRAPTLVLAGSEDPATPPAQGEAIARRIAGARLSVLEGAGHLANLEEPEAFNRLLLDHLATRPAVEVA